MFTKIEIERFRGIRHASIKGFKQINLFFGKNNCGKSSLLESLFLASGLSNPLLPIRVNVMRGYSKARLNDLKLDFYNLDTSRPIHIRMENEEKRDLDISLFEQSQNNVSINADDNNILSNVQEGKYGLKFDFKVNGRHYESQIRFDSANSTEATSIVSDQYAESLRCTYLSPKYDFNASIQGLKNILQNKDEHFIVEGLKIIEPRVTDFIFADNEMLVDIGLAKRIPVNMMGDGARKIVSLLTAVYDCKDGALLVDEISNGFHYSVMGSLWKVLINAAVRNNTQLFVTTHDNDSIKGLRNAALNEFDDIVAAFKLLKTSDDELKAYHYSLESLDYSINQEIEVR
ncbi:MAG: AAA family ATPase [Prevotella sp.]|uniref:AAA family ATPase n=1 Tax=Prevotella sp. TaxID=59823 RepID=UPI00257BB7C9|nr:AAA family ATPase [Prevotella sp.]MBS5875896.1 AAA family ATPase [Prevotella sp.]